MKTQKVAVILTILAVVFLSIGVVSAALSASDATITAQLSNPTPKPGNAVTVIVIFQSHVSQQLQILRYGIHADWMASADDFEGPNLSSNPVTVEANGQYNGSFLIVIPTTASIGSHTYYVGVDGVDASGQVFALNSAEATVQVVASSNTPTAGPSGSGGGQTPALPDWAPYLIVVAVVVIVVIIAFIVLKRNKRKTTATAPASAQTTSNPSESPKPEEKDFTI
jgi:preprotein translocase subunit SecG